MSKCGCRGRSPLASLPLRFLGCLVPCPFKNRMYEKIFWSGVELWNALWSVLNELNSIVLIRDCFLKLKDSFVCFTVLHWANKSKNRLKELNENSRGNSNMWREKKRHLQKQLEYKMRLSHEKLLPPHTGYRNNPAFVH